MLRDERWDTLVEADNGCETSVAVVQCAKAEEGKRGKCRILINVKLRRVRDLFDATNKNVNISNRNVKCVWFVIFK